MPFEARLIDWFQHTVLGGFKKLLDLDKDGSLGVNDLELLYDRIVAAIPIVSADAATWGTMTPGQRFDAICAFLGKEFPDVSPKVWMFLDGILWTVNFLKDQLLKR